MANRHAPMLAALLVAVASVLLAFQARADGACPYFTRKLVERGDGVTRMNTYAAGAWVCHRGTMHLCGSDGRWKERGPCTGYQDWQRTLACRLEGTNVDACKSATTSAKKERPITDEDGGGEGSGGGSGKARPGGGRAGAGSGPIGGSGSGGRPAWALSPVERGGVSGSAGGNGPDGSGAGGRPVSPGDGSENGQSAECRAGQRRVEREMGDLNRRMAAGGQGMCGLAGVADRVASQLDGLAMHCPREAGALRNDASSFRTWAAQIRSQVCRR